MAKKLQLLRNQTAFTDKATALNKLKDKLVSDVPQLAAGEPLIASYNETDGDKVGILLAISHGDGKNYQIFEGSKLTDDGTLEIPQEVKDAIKEAVDSIIGGASDGYDTLGEIETLIKGLQTELDTTQAGAGLETNGTYKAKGDANYISDATSLKSADEALDAALKAEKEARIAKDNELDGELEALSATVKKRKVIAGDGITVNTKGENTVVSAKVKADNNALKVDSENGLYVDESALEKYQGSNAIAVSEAQEGVKTISLTIDPSDKVLSQSATGLKTSIQIVKLGTPSGDTVREEFKLVGSDGITQLGETIKIYKDQSLQSAVLIQDDNGDDVLRLTYNLANGTTSVVDIDVSDFLREAEFGNGLQVVDGKVSIKLANGSEGFLTVGADGIKLDGVQNAINNAKNTIEAYTVNTKAISTNPVLNGADIALTGYKRSELANKELNIATTDTVNVAFGKLEKAILDNEEVCSKAFDAVATAVGLNRTGMTYVAPSGIYVSGATSVQDADAKLDAAIKTVSDKVTGIKDDKNYVKTVIVNGVTGSTTNNTATVTIDGGDITLTDYVKGSDSKDITDSDTINAAFGKVENKISTLDGNVLKEVEAGSGITVNAKDANKQTISAKAVDSDPIIEVTENGIGTKTDAVWDCGTYA